MPDDSLSAPSPEPPPEPSLELWTAVDTFLTNALLAPDPVLDAVLEAHAKGNLPPIAVTPAQGKFLHLLARIMGAKQILEIGTLAGYSTIWLARALPPEGKLITLEFKREHAAIARENFQRAGLARQIELLEGPALDSLPKVAAAHPAPFDLIFIDADKKNNPRYFEWALKLSRPGTVIIVDNVIRDGQILDPNSKDSDIQGTRALFELLHNEPRVSAIAVPVADSKGYDGFALALVL
jgi:predicted O-methyltransferase YrrM